MNRHKRVGPAEDGLTNTSLDTWLAQSLIESASGKSGRARAGMPMAGYPLWVRRRRLLFPFWRRRSLATNPSEDGLRRSTRPLDPGGNPNWDRLLRTAEVADGARQTLKQGGGSE